MIDASLQILIDDAEDQMQKSLEWLSSELNTLRAGRATPSMVENVRVDYYGSQTPLLQMASVNAPQPDLLIVQPWDRTALAAIEKSIQAANLGLNPSNDGTLIRIPVPPPSEERRKDLVKSARSKGEESKVAIRNIRRKVKDQIAATQQEESLSEDMKYEAEAALQRLTDGHIERVDGLLDRKEVEIMEI